jgi:hypothetical protein
MKTTFLATSILILAAGAIGVAATRSTLFTQEMPMPAEQHKVLLSNVGDWTGTLTAYMPGMPTEPTPATEQIVAIGGFWLRSQFECKFMGEPYVGTGVQGYDTEKNKYIGTWCDSMSSYLAVMEGEMDATGKKLTMHWIAPDMTGNMIPHRSETVFSKDSYVSTFFMSADTKEKSMVIDMKRKGKAVAK